MRYQAESRRRVVTLTLPLVDTNMTAGRGTREMSAERAAAVASDGLARGSVTIDSGAVRVLRALNQVAPAVAARVTRNS